MQKTSTTDEREGVRWIARQLQWERTLGALRDEQQDEALPEAA